MRCELCEELHCSDPTVFETDLESVPLTEYEEELLAKRKFFLIWGSYCSFVGSYVDSNNRPLSIEENGEHSLSWTKTCFQDLRAWLFFGQPHHVRTFIFIREEGNPTLVTRNNIRNPLRAICLKFLQPIAADCHPLFFLLCCRLVRDPSCAPLGPTKLLTDNSMCTSVAYTKFKAKNLSVIVGSSTINVSALCTELSVTDVRGLLARASSSTLSLPSLKCWIHLATVRNEGDRSS